MDVIIIGAGAAGLMAARELAREGIKVCVLEARDRTGGRIFPIQNLPFTGHADGGAEFIHGKLPLTLELLKEAQLDKEQLGGEMWQVQQGKWSQESKFFEHAETVIEKLKELKEDVTMAEVISVCFSESKFEDLRISIREYIEGYYSGNMEKISAKSFLNEWMSEDDEQYRPTKGYGPMVEYLLNAATKAGATFQLSTPVKEIRWTKGQVEVIDNSNHSYIAHKVLVTVPTGVLTAPQTEKGTIKFTPAIAEKMECAKQLGYGSVIKVLFYFNEPIIENAAVLKAFRVDGKQVHMVISDEEIPTWWTQIPRKSNLLTGWLSGPKADELADADDELVLAKSLESISSLLQIEIEILQQKLIWSKVINWTADPYTRGSYSYSTLHTNEARKEMLEPVDETIFFAGEGLYDGPEMGTVEAALTSGKKVATIIKQMILK